MSDICWDQLIKFEGYGAVHPRVVFIGYEERGPEKLDEQLRNVQARCEQMKKRGGNRGDKNLWHEGPDSLEWRDGHNPLIPGKVPVWNMASRIVADLAKLDAEVSDVLESSDSAGWQEEYHRLGTDDGTTLLTEYMPFPRPSVGAFKRTYLARKFRSAKQMEDEVRQRRLAMLRRVTSNPSVKYVFMYGARFDDLWPSIVGPTRWNPVPMKGRTAMIACRNGKVFVRTGFFGGAAPDRLQIPEIPDLIRAVWSARNNCEGTED